MKHIILFVFFVLYSVGVVVVVGTLMRSMSVVMKVYPDGTPIYRSRENGIEIFRGKIINNGSGGCVWFI